MSGTGDPRRDEDAIRSVLEAGRGMHDEDGAELFVESALPALDRLTARLQTLERAVAEIVAVTEKEAIAPGEPLWRVEEIAASALRAVVLEGRPQEQDSGGIASDASGTDSDYAPFHESGPFREGVPWTE